MFINTLPVQNLLKNIDFEKVISLQNSDVAISEKKIMVKIPQVHKVHTGIESFSYIGPKHRNSLPEDVKKSN